MQVPDAGTDMHSKGYNRYHCYSASQIQLFEAYLALDAAHSIQSCATIWASKRPASSNPGAHTLVLLPWGTTLTNSRRTGTWEKLLQIGNRIMCRVLSKGY